MKNPYDEDIERTELNAYERDHEARNALYNEREKEAQALEMRQYETHLDPKNEEDFNAWMGKAEEAGLREKADETNYDFVGQYYWGRHAQSVDENFKPRFMHYFAKPNHPEFDDKRSRYGKKNYEALIEGRNARLQQEAEERARAIQAQIDAYNALPENYKQIVQLLPQAKKYLDASEGSFIVSPEADDAEKKRLAFALAKNLMAKTSTYVPSEDFREWNDWQPMGSGNDMLQRIVDVLESNGESIKSNDTVRYEDLLKQGYSEKSALAIIAKEKGYLNNTMTNGDWILGSLKYSWKHFTDGPSKAKTIEEEWNEVTENELNEGRAKASVDVQRSTMILDWLNVADSISQEGNELLAKAILEGGADNLDIGHEAFAKAGLVWTMGDDYFKFLALSPEDKQKVGYLLSGARTKPEASVGQWVSDTFWGVADTALNIAGSIGDIAVRTPSFWAMDKLYGEGMADEFIRAETTLFNAARPLEADYGFVAGGLKGALEQLPIIATFMAGGGVARASALKHGGNATLLAKYSPQVVLSSWYASDIRTEFVRRGGSWEAGTLVGLVTAPVLSAIETQQFNTVFGGRLTEAQTRIAFANATRHITDTLVKKQGKFFTAEGVKILGDVGAAFVMETAQETMEEGAQKFVESLAIELGLSGDVTESLHKAAKDAVQEMYDVASTMGWVSFMGIGTHIARGTRANVALNAHTNAQKAFDNLVQSDASLKATGLVSEVQGEDGKSATQIANDQAVVALEKKWTQAENGEARLKVLRDAGLQGNQVDIVNTLFATKENIKRRYAALAATYGMRTSFAARTEFVATEENARIFADVVGLENVDVTVSEDALTLEFDGAANEDGTRNRETLTIRLTDNVGSRVADDTSANAAASVYQALTREGKKPEVSQEEFVRAWTSIDTSENYRKEFEWGLSDNAAQLRERYAGKMYKEGATSGKGDVITLKRGKTLLKLLHENFHRILRIAEKNGTITAQEAEEIKQRFTGKDGKFDEEKAADFYGSVFGYLEIEQKEKRKSEIAKQLKDTATAEETRKTLDAEGKQLEKELKDIYRRKADVDAKIRGAEESQGIRHTTRNTGIMGRLKDLVRNVGDAFWGYGDYEYVGDAIDTLASTLNKIDRSTLANVAQSAIQEGAEEDKRKALYDATIERLNEEEKQALKAIPKGKKEKRAAIREKYNVKREKAKAHYEEGKWKFSIGGIYTGSAADYAHRLEDGTIENGPSLHYVGTGEGAQVYGWWLYGSTVRGVAEKYAMPSGLEIRRHGNVVKPWNDKIAGLIRNNFSSRNPIESALKKAKENGWDQKAIESLENGDYEVVASHSNLYEQTFFTNRAPGDESHILDWEGKLTKEQTKWINAQVESEGVGIRAIAGDYGDMYYHALADKLGSPRAASEFLARAGIDGVTYIGNVSGVRNYVSFRDDNIRVDHKWVDGEQRYSVSSEDAAQAQREYDDVVARYTNPDGTKKEGWLKAPNGKPTNLTERQWVQVRTPSFKAWFGDWESNALLLAIEQLPSIDVVDREESIDAVVAYTRLKESRNEIDGRTIRFVNSALGKILRHKGYPAERIVHQLGEIYEKAVPIGFIPEEKREGHKEHRNFVGYHNYVGKIADEGKTYYVRITVQELKTKSKTFNPNEFHSSFISDVELYNETDALALNTAKSAGKVGAVGFIDNIIAKLISKNNNVSKVVDENGEPKIVYHGTYKHGFTVFKAKSKRIYTSTSKENADGYSLGKHGGTYALFANAKNPLVVDAEGSKWSRMKFKGIDKFKKALNTRVISPADLAVYAREHGYDGVVIKNVFDGDVMGDDVIVYQSNQLKSADVATYDDNGNLIPLSQRFNPYNDDTRFSIATRRPDLVGLHNMSEEGLKGADALGGFAMPSIAITRDSMGHNEFGDISLLMRTSAFDPKVSRWNKIYSRDAWTPTFPGIVNKPNIKHIIDVSERLLNTIPDNIRKAIGHNETYRLLYEDGIQEKFNSSNTAGDAYSTNAALKAAYLIAKGETLEPVMKPRTFLGRSNNRVLSLGEDGLRVINEAIGNLLAAFHSIPGAERIDWIDQHASEIEAAFIDAAYTSRIAKNPDVAEFTKEEVIGNLFKKDPLGFADVIDLADAVAELRKAIAKGEADAQIADEYATKRAIDERVPNHDPAFEAWLDEQYGDPILARGIRNDKDYYTSSGKRRSWDALHDPVTLANVVKVMLSKQRAQGEGFLGANPFGLTAAKFKSLKDVIKNEALLKELPKEEMDAIRDGFIQAFSEISERYSKTWKYRDSNPYTAVRESDDALLDAWADSKGTIAGLKRELNGYGRTADDELISDFKELMDGIAKFPTKYFEAKPMRGVGFDEVAAAIIPNNASDETREILNRRGVKMFEYEAGNETSRLAAINMAADEVEDTRFSVMSAGLNTNPNLHAEVEAALAFGNGQQVPARKVIEFSDVPAILKFVGVPTKRIFTQVVTVRKMRKKHFLTAEEIATLPEAYSTPIAIFTEGENWIVITDATASADSYNGKPIQVALSPSRSGENFIASAYAREASAETRYQEMAKKSKCYYLDVEKLNASGLEERTKATLRPLAESVSVKTPQDFLASPYATTISNSAADVNQKLSPANIAYAKAIAEASKMAYSIANEMNAAQESEAQRRLSTMMIEDILESSERRAAITLLSAYADDKDREVTLKEASNLIKAFGFKSVKPMEVTRHVNRFIGDSNRKRGEAFVDMVGNEAMQYNRTPQSRKAFSAGARTAISNALNVEPQRAVLQHELENLTGVTPVQFTSDNGFSVASSLLLIEDDEAKLTPEQFAARNQRRAEARERAELEREMLDGDLEATEALEAQAVAETLAPDRLEEFKARQDKIRNEAQKIREELDAREKSREEKRKEREALSANAEKTEGDVAIDPDEDLDATEDAIVSMLKEKGLEFVDVRDLVAYITQDVATRYMEANPQVSLKELSKSTPFLYELRKTFAAHLNTAARELTYGYARENVKAEVAKVMERKSFYGVLSSAEKAFSILQGSRVRQARKAMVKEMIKAINDAIGESPATATKAIQDRKVSGDLAMRLSYIRKVLKMGDTALQRELERLAGYEALNNETLYSEYRDPSVYRMQRDVINIYGGARQMMPAPLAMRRDELMNDINGGRAEHEAMLAQQREQVQELKNTLALAIEENAPEVIKDASNASKFIDSFMGMLRLRLEHLIDRSRGVTRERAMEAIDTIDTLFAEGANILSSQEASNKRKVSDLYKKAYGSMRKGKERLNEKLPDDVRAILSKQKVELTRNHALFIYATITQEDYLANAEAHGRMTREYLEALRSCFNEQDLAFLQGMRDILAEQFPTLQAEYKALTGSTVYTTPNYFPFKPKMETKDDATKSLAESRSWNSIIGEMTPRIRHGLDLDESITATDIFFDRLDKYARMKAYGRRGSILCDVLLSGTLAGAIERAWGKHFHSEIRKTMLDTFAGPRTTGNPSVKLINLTTRITALGQLAGNLSSALVQFSSGWIASAHEIGIGKALKNQWQVMFGLRGGDNVKRITNAIKAHPWYASRYEGGLDIHAREAMSMKSSSWFYKMYSLGMKPIQIADWWTSKNTMIAMTMELERSFLDQGLSPDEALDRAITLAGSHIERTQQSGRTMDQLSLLRSIPGTRLFMMFTGAVIQQAQYEIRAVQQFKAGVPGSSKKLVNTLLINHALIPLLVQLARSAFNALIGEDDDELTEAEQAKRKAEWSIQFAIECVLGPFSAIPFVGSGVSVFANRVLGGPSYAQEWSLANTEFLTRVGKEGFESVSEAVQHFVNDPDDQPTWDEVVKEFNDILRINPAWRTLDKASDNYTDKQLFEALGAAAEIDSKEIGKIRSKRTRDRKRREEREAYRQALMSETEED